MDIEHDVKVLQLDESLDSEVTKLRGDGWELIPGIKPVIVYHLARIKRQPSAAGIGRMVIDDSKVMIIPASKLPQ